MVRHAAVVGIRVGDEGKGIRVAHYAQQMVDQERGSVLVYRWCGAANAGHTAVIDGQEYKFHQVPVGVLLQRTYNLQGSGVYLHPRKEVREIQGLRERGVAVSPRNLGIASNCTVTLDYHTDEDRANLEKKEHTSTGNGVKQTAVDLFGRVGVRFAEFLDPKECVRALRERFPDGTIPGRGTIETFVGSYEAERDFLAPFMVLETDVFNVHTSNYKLGEGANGFDIDVINGLYPGVTSSQPSQTSHRPDVIIGALKLYDSSVGHNRPFVSRWSDRALEKELREVWGERGTTTGKDRYIGWVDTVAARHAIDTIGVDYLIGNCGDRLVDLHQRKKKVGLVSAYRIDGNTHHLWNASFHKRGTLERATPVIEEFESWPWFTRDGEIHTNALNFINRIQELTGKEFIALGTGPGINDQIELKSLVDLLD